MSKLVMRTKLNPTQVKFLEHIQAHLTFKHRWPASINTILGVGYYCDAQLPILNEVRGGYIDYLNEHGLEYKG